MAQPLRYFVRLDSALKPVIGSNIARPKKPKSGKWQEIFSQNCCVTLTTTPTGIPNDLVTFVLSCGDTDLINVSFASSIVAIGDLVTALNTALPILGTFSASGSDIVLDANSTILSAACPYDAITMTITAS